MNKFISSLCLAAVALSDCNAEVALNVFDHVTFYDGYLVGNIPESAPDEGCLRLYTFLNSKKLSDEQLNQLGNSLRLDITLFPLCDNYDRIASVNLALVPKGAESYTVKYDATDPMRIEAGRFITPFMDKNKTPNSVPYTFEVNYLSNILRDASLRENYDFWLELMVFGVPYAAQQQIQGCAGCNDVYQGSVDLVTDDAPAALVSSNVFVPITIRTADYRADRGMNNYNEACTDEVGKTVKTFTFEVPVDCHDGRVVLVMSNHGAGTNGEEYNRRYHYIYVDDELKLSFKPGRTSCEPFRTYNTQANGIYGSSRKSSFQWQSFSNWCPGDVIDNRLIEMGEVKAGTHTVRIEVPDAVFYGSDGYFPVSLFFQGDTESQLPGAGIPEICLDDYTSAISMADGIMTATAPEAIEKVEIFNIDGTSLMMEQPAHPATTVNVDLTSLPKGIYVAGVTTATTHEAHKFAR